VAVCVTVHIHSTTQRHVKPFCQSGLAGLRACTRQAGAEFGDNADMKRIAPLILTTACLYSIGLSSVLASSVLHSTATNRGANEPVQTTLPPIERIVPYVDQDYDFKLAIPEHWVRIYAAEDEADADSDLPGYAVGFESPRAGKQDRFADYLMVEVLPGSHSGAFDSDGSEQQVIMVDGRVAVTDKVYLDDFDVGGASLDLVVYQAEIIELGYTVAVFAIGERHEAEVLADAFNLALKTLKIPDDPFSMS